MSGCFGEAEDEYADEGDEHGNACDGGMCC